VATRAENIQTRLDAIALELATTTWGPSMGVDGVTIDNTPYRMSLLEEQTLLVQALIVAQGPFVVVSVAR
jgi:hypothetical protein